MNKGTFFIKTAFINILKNAKFYVPFFLIGILSVSMFFNMDGLLNNPTIPGGDSFAMVMSFGVMVIAFFCAIFLFYTNSFLIRRRKKELGLYNILGMEKRHIARIIFWETIISAVICICGGMLFGMLFDRLIFLLLNKFLKFSVHIEYSLNPKTFEFTAIYFSIVFLLILAKNLFETLRAKPIDLLKSENKGEREPKAKWPVTVIGVVTLLAGYVLAVTTTNAMHAVTYFFIAVILVIIGTYCLFTSVSITVLKSLQKNKDYYYQPNHFASVSGMLYRMKQNAVGLANICILSTMVIVMVATTTSLYTNVESIVNRRYPSDVNVLMKDCSSDAVSGVNEKIEQVSKKTGLKFTNYEYNESMFLSIGQRGDAYFSGDMTDKTLSVCMFTFMTPENYEKITGVKPPKIEKGEWGVYTKDGKIADEIEFMGKKVKVKHIDGKEADGELSVYVSNVYYVAVPDREELQNVYELQRSVYSSPSSIDTNVRFDVVGTDDDKIKFADTLREQLDIDKTNEGKVSRTMDFGDYQVECRADGEDSFYDLYGGFLFLGIFLGFLFIMVTVLIMYYKQLVEGYDDRERFEIMQKVGMSKDEVKKTIKSQILTLFFMPLITAIVHFGFSIRMLRYMLAALNLTDATGFFICAGITIVVYAICYTIVYAVTARTYYKIVSE